ncbi:MAG: undecaprenyl/decaprenyl-phosphate alpha-N-acetylglucosaminyl 1-phosphate transferase [Verrucomicrobia bacterium]|nr:undecaprenyl/decaprenyl-phosphate alpha-N-acetylglucosaminyl 1-phosphate transferase [Verrucomicrobiota bacterium]
MNPTPTLFTLIAAFASAVFAALLLFPWKKGAQRWGLVDDPGHRKIHSEPIPLSGGPAILSALLLSSAVGWIYLILSSNVPLFVDLDRQFSLRATSFFATAGGAVAMTLLGIFDDRFELRPANKFLGQLAVAIAVTIAGVRFSLFDHSPVLDAAITVLWILTVTNAFNFVDNMNGLCAGLGAIAAGFIAALALLNGALMIAFSAAALAGALMGFLPSNYPRAFTFLGDSGSHLTGFLLSVLSIEPSIWPTAELSPLRFLTPLILLAVPLADLCWVVVLRTLSGKPFYIGDTNHFSHQLVRIGFSRPIAVAILWFAALAAGGTALFLSLSR